jgi:hypothetical protein
MCEMQKYIPPTFFNAQEHYLLHQVEEIEICGPIHTSVVGKSPCGQVDCLKELDPNSKTESA